MYALRAGIATFGSRAQSPARAAGAYPFPLQVETVRPKPAR